MKKFLAVALSVAMALSVTACGGSSSSDSSSDAKTESTSSSADTYKAALVLNGTLGDKSFYDSANEGLTKLRDELGSDVFDFKVEEMGGTSADEANWEPTLLDYCDSGEYDVIIVGTWQMSDPLAKAASEYPDQKFIFFDETYDFETNGNNNNIYNVMFKQNEVSYLVGAAAAMMTTDASIEGIDPSNKVIGFLGGMDGQVINDFLVGYIQGATDVDPDTKVAVSMVGDYIDSAKGKDLSLAQFQAGSDIGFNVAGNAGLGLIEAASESGKYAFGVDSDQAALLPDYASCIPTSALKNVGTGLYRAIKLDMDGQLKYGQTETLGLAEDGVGLVEDAHYEEVVPENIRTKVAELKQEIVDGKITVKTANGMETSELEALKASVAVQ